LLNPEEFRAKFQHFKKIDYGTYPYCFGEFWKWKLQIENESEHILNTRNAGKAYAKLSQTLKIWQWHRPYSFSELAARLKHSLDGMRDSYNQIRRYSLLEFDKIPDEQLESIWHELGCVKAFEKNLGGNYLAMATTKPLMFLWGQTLAFDSVVRERMPKFNFSRLADNYWSFETWKKVMMRFQEMLKLQPEITELFKKVSLEEYGTDSVVPYGQLIDLYYWVRCK
jgi:hypothetical protein